MPRLPDSTALGQRPVPTSRRQVVQDQSGQIIGQGVSQLGENLQRIGAEFEDRQSTLEATQARSSLLVADIQTRQELQADPDWSTYEKRYRDKMSGAIESTAAGIKNIRARQMFQAQAQLDVARGSAAMAEEAQKKRVDLGHANTVTSLDALRMSALQAPDQGTRAAAVGAAQQMIDASVTNGDLSAEQGAMLKKSWTADYAEGAVKMLPFDQQIETLLQRGQVADFLQPDKRMELLDSAMRGKIAETNQREAMLEKQKKEVEQATTKNGDLLLAQGKLTPDWIESNRNILDPSDYRYFYNKLNGGDEGSAPRNIPLYADLRDRAGRGEDVRSDARAALQRGAIRVADYDRIIGETEQQRPGWYKRGAEYIKSMSGISLMNPAPDAPQAYAAMKDQWDDWSQEHPNATDREAQSAYQDLVSHNMLVQRAGLPLPRLLVGGRFAPDLVASVKATMKAHDKGEMNDDDYAREMEVLQRWKRTLDAEKGQVPPK